jgi:tetratricopeptide (TPR) repeat protein
MLKEAEEAYTANLDNDPKHPFLESIYNQIGSMAAKQGRPDTALEQFQKILSCREAQFGENHKECITPLMQIQHMSGIVIS